MKKIYELLREKKKPLIMGIINVTPDSFSGDGLAGNIKEAVKQAERFAQEGADILDVGGESSRPGSEPVSVAEEYKRVVPFIKEICHIRLPISVDTTKASIAEEALKNGATIVNDITALRFDPSMVEVVLRYDADVILMHMLGTPKNMQQNSVYEDVVKDIMLFLGARLAFCEMAGIKDENIFVDPGIGFGKTVEHNLEIVNRLSEFKVLHKPLVVGPSRKSFIGSTLNLPVEERLEGTAAVVALCVQAGADILRVHDVKAMRRAADMAWAVVEPGGKLDAAERDNE